MSSYPAVCWTGRPGKNRGVDKSRVSRVRSYFGTKFLKIERNLKMILNQGKETVAVILNQKGTKMADSDQGKVDTYSK